jgi:hypothetical protein
LYTISVLKIHDFLYLLIFGAGVWKVSAERKRSFANAQDDSAFFPPLIKTQYLVILSGSEGSPKLFPD